MGLLEHLDEGCKHPKPRQNITEVFTWDNLRKHRIKAGAPVGGNYKKQG